MQHRELGNALEHRRQNFRHQSIDAERALASAEHEQAGLAVGAQRRDVEESGANRHAGDPGQALRASRRWARTATAAAAAKRDRPAVGEASLGIRLDQHGRPARQPPAEHRRSRGVAAGADHHIESAFANLPPGRERREDERQECGELLPESLAEERPRRERHERQTALRGEARLHASRRTGEAHAPAAARELVTDRERRKDVSTRSATGEQRPTDRARSSCAPVSHVGRRSGGRRRWSW